MPHLVQMQQAYEKKGFVVVAVTDASVDDAMGFTAEHGLNYPILAEAEWEFDAFGVNSTPATFLIDPDGQVVETDFARIKTVVRELLGQ